MIFILFKCRYYISKTKSHRLNRLVLIILKLKFSSLYNLTSSEYIVIGDDPVANPKTHISPFSCFFLILSAMQLAT